MASRTLALREPEFAVAVAPLIRITHYHAMTLLLPRCCIVAFVLACVSFASASQEPDIVLKARAFIGPESVLSQVHSIQYRGTLTTDDGRKVAVEVIYQKPAQHRLTAASDVASEITALDDLEGWMRMQDAKGWKFTLLQSGQVRRLRANTFECLNFFSVNNFRGKFSDLGEVDLEGRRARKLLYKHADDISFTRYFDIETGRLLKTETERGGTITEEGELLSGGLRFPKRVISKSCMSDGSTRSATIEFDTIVVNETFAADLFAVPSAPH